jgi:hypothetical protein
MTEPAYQELAVHIVTRRAGKHRNHDAIGVQGWVMVADQSSLSLRFPASPGAMRVAVAAGGDTADGGRYARLSADWLARRSADASSEMLVRAFLDADDEIRRLPESARSVGCSAAAIAIAADGRAVAGGIGRVQIFRMVEGYAGRLTPSDGTGGLGTLDRSRAVSPYEFRALPRDRLIMCTQDVDDAALAYAGGDAPAVARYLVEQAWHRDSASDMTAIVLDVVGDRPPAPTGPALPQRATREVADVVIR